MTIPFQEFDALTFDCYGTLIDWERGILAALRPVLAEHGADADDEELLEAYARHEAALESGSYLRYRDVLAGTLRGIAGEHGFTPTDEDAKRFAASIRDWPAFADTPAALAALKARFRLGVVTNCDDDLFALSRPHLGVDFDWVVTAEQARSYKPSERNFLLAFERIDVPRERILHVAQSLFHDHVPAKRLGMTTAWIDRRGDRTGFGATLPAEASPDLVAPDMRTFAEAALAG
ncbi:MAG TPA: haloacid dehalogenase type II [Gaiellales bacterium]|nr:haloacid dehalogenase type II [Gaiellales bacterium]